MVNEDHVMALRGMGYRAYLFYIEDADIGYFSSRAPVLRAGNSMAFSAEDVIVIPEPWRLHIDSFAPMRIRKVMHCQNPYYLFNGVDDISCIKNKGITAIISCSNYTTSLLQRMGYDGMMQTVQPQLSPLFTAGTKKILQIAYMPRKREFESSFIKGLFKSIYPNMRDVPWIPIDNMSLAECAQVLQESAVFAAFSHIEGLGLPPLEAMASGCVVVGFNGLGGADYSTPNNGFWIAEGDHMGFAHGLAEGLRAAAQPDWYDCINHHALVTARQYSNERFQNEIRRFWELYLGEDKHEYLLGTN